MFFAFFKLPNRKKVQYILNERFGNDNNDDQFYE